MDLQSHYNNFVKFIQQRQINNNLNPCYPVKGYERHHLIPRSKGGKWTEDNLILVTKREHIHMHWMLWKLNPEDFSYCAAYCRTKTGIQPQCYPPDSAEYKAWYNATKPAWDASKIPIVCMETNTIYESITQAMYLTDIEDTHLRECIYEGTSTCKGLHFVTKAWYDDATEEQKLLKLQDTVPHRMSINKALWYYIDANNSILYKSARIASELTNIPTGQVMNNANKCIDNWYKIYWTNYYDLMDIEFNFDVYVKLNNVELNELLKLCS